MRVGSYRLVKEIARGGMGTVWEAQHTVLPRRAAVKVMHGELCCQPGMATRVVQEAALLEDLRHPGLVRVYECNVLADHRPWIAMELVDGETLATRLSRGPRLEWVEISTLIANVADVLAAVHTRGIVHRDLKPDNLLLTPDSDYPVRVIDWGIARIGPVSRLTLEGLAPGTPIYMSPEQATSHHVAAPSDLYSLGVIAYEALSGAPPFAGHTLAEIVSMHLACEPPLLRPRNGAPLQLCRLVHRMLDKEPANRPMAVDVRQVLRDLVLEVAHPYEKLEVVVDPTASAVASAESVDVDLEELEYGVTELMPAMRKPRWTPQLGPRAITPRNHRDQVAGEIVRRNR
jgi:serine/threonine-protein kinase